jgi:UDP-3-O-[3-hydroxymyristoyl] glucosamine N-acyltransferase
MEKKGGIMPQREFRLDELAALTHSKLIGNPDWIITNVSDLESAEAADASFLANPRFTPQRYENAMRTSRAGVIFIGPTIALVDGKNYLIHENPSQAFQKLVDILYEDQVGLTHCVGIHPTAIIHESCKLSEDVYIGPYVVIEKDVQVGAKTSIGAGSYVGQGVKIGHNCFIHPHVTIRELCRIGNRVILQPGVVIGSCGFGYINDPKTRQHVKLNQVGIVILEDDVEVGANSTIDRARFKATVIGKGTKIDNLVQIGHGVKIGPHNIIVAQTGIAGSSQTGQYVVMGGQVALNGHIKLADGVILAGRAGATKSLTKPGTYGGVPAIPLNDHNRQGVYVKHLEETVNELKRLKKRVEELEAK